MRKPKKEIQLTSYDELLGINEAEQNTLNQIVEVPLNELHPFRNHPFHVNDDEKMAETVESCFLSSTFPEKKRQNSLFLARDFPCFRQDVLCILTHEGMFHPVAFSLKDQ